MAKKESSTVSKRMQRRAEARAKKRRTYLTIGAVVAVLVIALGALGIWINIPGSAPATETVGLPAEVNIDEAYQLVQDGAFLLDVREQYEWDDFHATDADMLIPLGELASRVDEVPRDQDVVVICNSGNRSQEGRDILLAAGYENVTSAAGGSQAWRAAGYPVE